MEKQIAECADRIVRRLEVVAEMNVLRLAEHLGERSVVAYQALGWLAREGRVRYTRRGSEVYISRAPGADAEAVQPAGSDPG